jgi:predicted ATP-grasp superfamily ATP-dependent carboligase
LLDGSQKSTLAVLRSLGRKGIDCEVGEFFTPNLCTKSKYCTKIILYPSPLLNMTEFKLFILKYIENNYLDAVFPMTDITIPLVLDVLENSKFKYLISHINKEKYLKASDKSFLLKIAKSLLVPYPETIIVDESTDITKTAGDLDYPVVLKPAKSKHVFKKNIIQLNVSYAKNPKELTNILELGQKYKCNYLVQRFIKGEGIGFFCLYQENVPIKMFYHKRILEKPPSGGVSVLCESINPDLQVMEYATKMLNELQWHGVAMVEFKKEFETGIPYLMEINARFWGSLELAIISGVDFPFDLYKMICGKDMNNKKINYKVGNRCCWITGLMDHIFILLKEKKYEEITKSIMKIIKPQKNFCDFVLKINDCNPFIYEICKNLFYVQKI